MCMDFTAIDVHVYKYTHPIFIIIHVARTRQRYWLEKVSKRTSVYPTVYNMYVLSIYIYILQRTTRGNLGREP